MINILYYEWDRPKDALLYLNRLIELNQESKRKILLD